MRSCLIIAVCLTIPWPALAQTGVSKLTPEEVREGWLLLFDGETTFGWKTDGPVKIENGTMILGGDKASSIHCTTPFNHMVLELETQLTGMQAARLELIENEASAEHMGIDLELNKGETWSKIKASVWQVPEGELWGLGLTQYHPSLRPLGYGVVRKRQPDPLTLVLNVSAGATLRVRNVKVRPTGMTSLFNGKDLKGWKEHPGKKSKFTVTPQGWLNIKDGPGDLQTEEKWANFIFQCECISNGKHLNSGIFFRCRPGEYQQGYEAQIRNQFTAEPTQPYLVEEYDAQTGALTGKKKIMSTAVDYGTGAIYRRVPARKGIAKDGEWFALTVLAQERHLTTWVNGIQVVDWTDQRPLADNARKGCYLQAGPISLQGHDPTTDLSFRNFRLARITTGK